MIKKTSLDAFEKISNRGLTIAKLVPGDELQWCHRCTDEDDVLISSTNAMAVRFPSKDLRPASRTTIGVRAMKLKDGDSIADMNVIHGDTRAATDEDDGSDEIAAEGSSSKEFVLCVTQQGFGKRVPTNAFRSASRGNQGVIAAKFKKRATASKADKISCFTIVHEDDEILLITAKGIIVRQLVSKIPIQSRTGTGVVVQKIDDSDYIASVSLVPKALADGDS
jgi:DNA gyrase subunit A